MLAVGRTRIERQFDTEVSVWVSGSLRSQPGEIRNSPNSRTRFLIIDSTGSRSMELAP